MTSRKASQHGSNHAMSGGEIYQSNQSFVCTCPARSSHSGGQATHCKRITSLEPALGRAEFSSWIMRHGASFERKDLIKLYLAHKLYPHSQLVPLMLDIFSNIKQELAKWDKPEEVLREVCRLLHIPLSCPNILPDDDETERRKKWIKYNQSNCGFIMQYYFYYCRQSRTNNEINRMANSIYKDFVKLYGLNYLEHYLTFDDNWLRQYLSDHPAYEKFVLFLTNQEHYPTDIQYALPCTWLLHANRPISKPDVEFVEKNGRVNAVKPDLELVNQWKSTYLCDIVYDPQKDDLCDCLNLACEGCQPLCLQCGSKKCKNICRQLLQYCPNDISLAKNPEYYIDSSEIEAKRQKLNQDNRMA